MTRTLVTTQRYLQTRSLVGIDTPSSYLFYLLAYVCVMVIHVFVVSYLLVVVGVCGGGDDDIIISLS